MNAVFLVPDNPVHETVKVLSGLLDLAKEGQVNGLIFGVSFKGHGEKYYCDSAGALHRSPIRALGVACMLKTDLERKMRQESIDTMF
jgi:hypothetical protein